MGWRSYFSRKSDKIDVDVKPDNQPPGPRDLDRVTTPDRRQEIVDALKTHLQAVYRSRGEAVDKAAFDPHLNLHEAGYLDSLSASEFLLLAERQYNVALPDWLIGGDANTLTALAEYIDAELARNKSNET